VHGHTNPHQLTRPTTPPNHHDVSNAAPTKAMERDISTNYWQHGAQKLCKMAAVYRALTPEQRLVQLPQVM
jgi:hypothetical protein